MKPLKNHITPGSPEISKLSQYFDRFKKEDEPPTFPAEKPDRRIDYILLRKGSDLKIVDERVDPVPYSDHLPLIATLEWKKEGRKTSMEDRLKSVIYGTILH